MQAQRRLQVEYDHLPAVFIGAALSSNIQSHIIFRFLAGLYTARPLICVGGTVAGCWDPQQKTHASCHLHNVRLRRPHYRSGDWHYILTCLALGWRWLEWIRI